jgi:hypothetical protein
MPTPPGPNPGAGHFLANDLTRNQKPAREFAIKVLPERNRIQFLNLIKYCPNKMN